MPYELPPLPYDYAALEPNIDEETMRIHHDKHHATYVNNLNAALEKHPQLHNLAIEDLLRSISKVPPEIRPAVVNNGGGHANHTLFWEVIRPGRATRPGARLAAALELRGGVEATLQQLTQAGLDRFGSGWAWITVEPNGQLQVESTANQDSPLTLGRTPILGVDVWEHAYYLKYQNRRAEYLKAWANLIDWGSVTHRYEAAVQRRDQGAAGRR